MKSGNGTRAVKCPNGVGIPFHKTGFAYRCFFAIRCCIDVPSSGYSLKICKCLTLKLPVSGLVMSYVRSDEDEIRVIIMDLE